MALALPLSPPAAPPAAPLPAALDHILDADRLRKPGCHCAGLPGACPPLPGLRCAGQPLQRQPLLVPLQNAALLLLHMRPCPAAGRHPMPLLYTFLPGRPLTVAPDRPPPDLVPPPCRSACSCTCRCSSCPWRCPPGTFHACATRCVGGARRWDGGRAVQRTNGSPCEWQRQSLLGARCHACSPGTRACFAGARALAGVAARRHGAGLHGSACRWWALAARRRFLSKSLPCPTAPPPLPLLQLQCYPGANAGTCFKSSAAMAALCGYILPTVALRFLEQRSRALFSSRLRANAVHLN